MSKRSQLFHFSLLSLLGIPLYACAVKDHSKEIAMSDSDGVVAPARPLASRGAVRLMGLAGLSDFVAKAEPELAANAMLCAVNQAAYLLRRQVEQQSREFLEKGGFTERLYAARVKARTEESDKSDRSDSSDKSDAPACPQCRQPMRKRTARKGPRAGQSFWGCSAYPKCKGTFEISDKPDQQPAITRHRPPKQDSKS